MLRDVFAECVRVLEPGGRIAVNVANLGRRPYRSLAADVTTILQDDLRLLLRGEVVWVKQRGAAGNCAWGSFQRPGNPVLRDLSERVIIASKGRFDRAIDVKQRAKLGLPSVSTLSRDEFMEATVDVWEIPPERAGRVGHPAPFPVALPERLIHMNTYVGDLVLDPFIGSGHHGGRRRAHRPPLHRLRHRRRLRRDRAMHRVASEHEALAGAACSPAMVARPTRCGVVGRRRSWPSGSSTEAGFTEIDDQASVVSGCRADATSCRPPRQVVVVRGGRWAHVEPPRRAADRAAVAGDRQGRDRS